MNMNRIFLVVLVIAFLFGESYILPTVINIIPKENAIVIVEEKPEAEYIDRTKDLAGYIKQEDKLDVCIVNHEFSKRVEGYLDRNVSGQQLVLIYTDSNKGYFNGKLSNKEYGQFSSGMRALFTEVVGIDEGKLTPDQLKRIKNFTAALSWNLQQ